MSGLIDNLPDVLAIDDVRRIRRGVCTRAEFEAHIAHLVVEVEEAEAAVVQAETEAESLHEYLAIERTLLELLDPYLRDDTPFDDAYAAFVRDPPDLR